MSCLLFFISGIFHAEAQLSKTHYIPPLTSAEPGNAYPEDQYIYISTPNNNDIPYTIKPMGQPPANYITGVVSNSNPTEIYIGTGSSQLFVTSSQTSMVTNNKGYIIEAEDVIYVSVRMEAGGAQAGALVSKGLSGFGTTFRVGSFTNENPGSNYLNFVSVMATEDNTQVTFDDLPAGLSIKSYSGSFPISVNLDKGESYIVATNSFESVINRDGLIGTLVQSDNPVVVNCGSANGSFHNGGARDYGIDQIVDYSKVGKEYIFVKGVGQNGWENVLIVAHVNNTSISINGAVPVVTINAGDYYLIEGDQYNANGNMYVETSNPAFAYQGVGATNSEANQGLFFVPPLSCENRGNLNNIANIDRIGNEAYNGGITMVTNRGATVTINNLPLSNYTTNGPFDVTGNSDYVTYKITGLSGNISVQCDAELYCAYFNENDAATSGSFYSGFPSAPEINFDAVFVTIGNCIPNITLSAANTENFDTFEWWLDDGSGTGFVGTGINTPELTPTVPGKYKLIGIIACSGLTLESVEVPVSICPDDIDNDGIIDNIDVDNDNDGILNCDESKGNINLNLLDIYQPQLLFQDGTTDGSVATASFAQSNSTGNNTNTIIGTATGNLISSVAPASSAESNYSIAFSRLVNVNFSEDITATHNAVVGEYFIVKISPVNKNITLLDPDDRLLVDSNFDGIFETGINQISGSEIHFKVNPSPTGTTPYEFLANDVDGFSFIHKLANITDTSTFKGIISLTCFSLDSDGDGIEDALDFDCDNDGIPDRIESLGENYQPLSNIDTDMNGLDDMFNGISPLDTDNDTVLDYLDLDSDNDGVYDVEESGGLFTDADLDGIIDGILGSIGNNGWHDAAETSPDSGEIGYSLNDLDTDTFFNYIDSDSDGDSCVDVIEAGFSDGNGDAYLGDALVTVNSDGIVTNASDGYTVPHTDYITSAPITITTQPSVQTTCELGNADFTIETNIVDSYQWQLSTDGTNWSDIIDDAIYSNSTTNTLSLTNIPLSYHNNKYRVQLTKSGNTCGFISDEVALTVNPLPIPTIVPDLFSCDDLVDGNDVNGIVQNFDLESQTNGILGALNAADYIITYHISATNADAGINPLTSPHENSLSPVSQTIYVRLLNNSTGCYDANLTFNVIVNPLPISNTVLNLELCDNLDDGNDTNGIVQDFDLESRTNTILGAQAAADYAVSYHISAADAISGSNPLTSPHSNTLSPDSQTIYISVRNKNTGCINPQGTFEVIVTPLPIANPVLDLPLCDNSDDGNDTNGIVQTFDLDSQTLPVLGALQLPTDYTVTYHLSQNDAISGNNALASPHANTGDPFLQKIHVRILDTNKGCVNPHLTFDLIVHPLPIITNLVTLKQCDDDTDGISAFNLTEVNDEISADAANETFRYYTTLADAIAGISPIPDPTSYKNQTAISETVWAAVATQNNCTSIAEIQLIVSTTKIPASYMEFFNECDDFLDAQGNDTANNDDRDGITTFDFSSVDAEVRAFYPASMPLIVNYYRNKSDALAEENPISDISNYRNIGYPNTQIIYVRVDSELDNDCEGLGPHITLNVEELPDFTVISPQIICITDPVSSVVLDVSQEDPSELFNFEWRDSNGTLVATTPSYDATAPDTYTVTLIKTDSTGCSRPKEIVLNPSEQANISLSDLVIVDDSDNNTVTIKTANLGIGNYEFAMDDPYGMYQDEPFFDYLEAGVHTMYIQDKNGCEIRKIDISIIAYPKFFTPNNDGYNDTWKIKGVDEFFYTNSNIYIFDRFGKLIMQVDPRGEGWDGLFNGNALPASDYWYSAELIDAEGNIRVKKGHFSLIR